MPRFIDHRKVGSEPISLPRPAHFASSFAVLLAHVTLSFGWFLAFPSLLPGQVLDLSPEQVRAFELRVMEKIADLALIPPQLNTTPLPRYDYDQLDYGMTIGIARTPGGRLWAA